MFSHSSRLLHLQRRGAPVRLGGLGAIVLAGAAVLSCVGASGAQGALVSTGACSEAAVTQPFARWGDANLYELVPQGDFETTPSEWSLSGGAYRASGSESYGATGTVGGYSLALPAGASAQSPYSCVDASYPTFRLFARGTGGLATVAVSVVYKTLLGTVALPLGLVVPGGSWQPTQPMLTGSGVAGLLTGGTAQAALHFTAVTGSTEIDDVYLDPRMR